ncbi:hypothetical protein GOBAR_AA37499 [Gossypium barbadense]|uniref:Uncharacterized protein n=1 Tax=Gossypium barbadense TaxID=3634 RepID=A0A2P5VWK7_GOSBA|nr:hypothetical protein GOBAR_AA37499 [Gossypium barbadense]
MSAFVNICMSHKSGNLVAKLMANEVFKDENCTFSIEETPTEKLPNYVVPDLTDFKERTFCIWFKTLLVRGSYYSPFSS